MRDPQLLYLVLLGSGCFGFYGSETARTFAQEHYEQASASDQFVKVEPDQAGLKGCW